MREFSLSRSCRAFICSRNCVICRPSASITAWHCASVCGFGGTVVSARVKVVVA